MPHETGIGRVSTVSKRCNDKYNITPDCFTEEIHFITFDCSKGQEEKRFVFFDAKGINNKSILHCIF